MTPYLDDERMAAQSSCFTFHPPECGDITSSVARIAIPAATKPQLRILLRKLGTTRATLFGGIDGVAASLVVLLHEADLTPPRG